MWNWTFQVEKETEVNPEAIWALWTDVKGWPKWDSELEWAKIDGPFAKGTKGELKPKGWIKSPFVITEVKPHVGFSDVTPMPLTTLSFHHRIEKKGQNFRVTHRVEARGLLAPLLRLTLKRKLVKGLPLAIEKLIRMAHHE